MRLEVLTVDHLDEVLALALRGASLHEGRLTFAEVAEAGRPVLDTAH
jgi:hypothetical protein